MISITHDQLIELQAEIRDYRKALKEIADAKDIFIDAYSGVYFRDLKWIAQNSLNQYEADHGGDK